MKLNGRFKKLLFKNFNFKWHTSLTQIFLLINFSIKIIAPYIIRDYRHLDFGLWNVEPVVWYNERESPEKIEWRYDFVAGNATPHKSQQTCEIPQRFKCKEEHHLSHSPELALFDFHVFGRLKKSVCEQ